MEVEFPHSRKPDFIALSGDKGSIDVWRAKSWYGARVIAIGRAIMDFSNLDFQRMGHVRLATPSDFDDLPVSMLAIGLASTSLSSRSIVRPLAGNALRLQGEYIRDIDSNECSVAIYC